MQPRIVTIVACQVPLWYEVFTEGRLVVFTILRHLLHVRKERHLLYGGELSAIRSVALRHIVYVTARRVYRERVVAPARVFTTFMPFVAHTTMAHPAHNTPLMLKMPDRCAIPDRSPPRHHCRVASVTLMLRWRVMLDTSLLRYWRSRCR